MKDYLKDYLHDNKLYIAGGIFAFIAASYLGSVILYFLFLHLDPDLARPWTAWYFLNDAYFQNTRLDLACGCSPCIYC